jgi:hypothetical protein
MFLKKKQTRGVIFWEEKYLKNKFDYISLFESPEFKIFLLYKNL